MEDKSSSNSIQNKDLDSEILDNLQNSTSTNLKNNTDDRSALLNAELLKKLRKDANRNGLNEFICGWSAAFVNILITFPINKIMFRQMAYGVKAKSAVSQFKGENLQLSYIYRGLLPPLLSKTISGNLF